VWALGNVRVRREGSIVLGDRVFFLEGPIASEIVCHRGAHVRIGDGTGFNYGVAIEAHEAIEIGARCLIASAVRITDRGARRTAPVRIEDDVWIGHGAIIEPGVTVGKGAVVSAGSVVTTDVPPGRLALGNPARMLPLETVTTPRERA
jgi:maltose O-acetyltransferase